MGEEVVEMVADSGYSDQEHIEKLTESVVNLRVEVVQLTALLACAGVREKALREKLAALQHVGQAGARVTIADGNAGMRRGE